MIIEKYEQLRHGMMIIPQGYADSYTLVLSDTHYQYQDLFSHSSFTERVHSCPVVRWLMKDIMPMINTDFIGQCMYNFPRLVIHI